VQAGVTKGWWSTRWEDGDEETYGNEDIDAVSAKVRSQIYLNLQNSNTLKLVSNSKNSNSENYHSTIITPTPKPEPELLSLGTIMAFANFGTTFLGLASPCSWVSATGCVVHFLEPYRTVSSHCLDDWALRVVRSMAGHPLSVGPRL